MPSNQLVVLIVECLNNAISCRAQTNDRQVSSPVEHVIVVGSPFVAMDDVLLWLVAFQLNISIVESIVKFERLSALGLYILDNYEPPTMIVFEFDWKANLQVFLFFSARLAKHFNAALEVNLTRLISTREVEEGLCALAVLLVVAAN
jgi:hypothetical protein